MSRDSNDPLDAPDPTDVPAFTPAPAVQREGRPRRSLIGRKPSLTPALPEYDPDVRDPEPMDAPVPVAVNLARAGVLQEGDEVRVNTHTPPPVRRVEEQALDTEPPVKPAPAAPAEPPEPEPAPAADHEAPVDDDPVLQGWSVTVSEEETSGPREVLVVPRWAPWGMALGGLVLLAAVLLVGLAVGLSLGQGPADEAAPAQAAPAAPSPPSPAPPPPEPAPEPEPSPAAPTDGPPAEAAEAPSEAPAPDGTEAAEVPPPAPEPAPASPPPPAPEAAPAPRPAPPAARVRPKPSPAPAPAPTEAPVVEEESGRKVWSPFGEAPSDEGEE